MATKRSSKKKEPVLAVPPAERADSPTTPAVASEPAAAPAPEMKLRATTKTSHRSRKTAAAAAAVAVAETSSGDVAALASAVSPEPATYPADEIARLAYQYWEQRGHTDGFALEDWIRAEQQVLSQSAVR